MDSVAALRERLLLLAQMRLKNRPLELEALRHELSGAARLGERQTLEKRLLALTVSADSIARALRGPEGHDQDLLSLIDDWSASRAAIQPQALPPRDYLNPSGEVQSAPARSAMLAPGASGESIGDSEPRAWLELEPGERLVHFADIAHRLANALHPVPEGDGDHGYDYGFARAQFDEELAEAVRAGTLIPRNQLTGGRHALPLGTALSDTVVNLQDLKAFARERDIGVRVRPSDSELPTGDTLAEASVEVQEVPSRASNEATPVQRFIAQERRVMSTLEGLGYSPRSLPKAQPGKPGVKTAVRKALKGDALFQGERIFEKAWERLRSQGDIADARSPKLG